MSPSTAPCGCGVPAPPGLCVRCAGRGLSERRRSRDGGFNAERRAKNKPPAPVVPGSPVLPGETKRLWRTARRAVNAAPGSVPAASACPCVRGAGPAVRPRPHRRCRPFRSGAVTARRERGAECCAQLALPSSLLESKIRKLPRSAERSPGDASLGPRSPALPLRAPVRSIPRKSPNITSGLCEQLFSVRLPPPGPAHLPELPIARFALLGPGKAAGLMGKKSNFGERLPRSSPDPIQTPPRSGPAQRARTRTQTRTHVPRSRPERAAELFGW